jgi:glutaconate CoA-transferase subunit A
MTMTTSFGPDFVGSVAELVDRIRDGDELAVAKAECGVAMEATRRLIAAGRRGLRMLTLPTSSIQADLLIGAGCLREIETSGVSLGELGQAPAFGRAVRSGSLRVKDSSCPAIYAALQAGEKGVPFMPLRGLIGSDILSYRDDIKVIGNPFADGADPIVLLPALRPRFALFHAPLADRLGNVWIGRQKPLMLLAHAAHETLVTVEEVVDLDLLNDELYGPATIPSLYVSAIGIAPRGAWPLGLAGRYDADTDHLALYARMAATAEGFAAYLAEHVTAGIESAGAAR